jgi:2-amino-4-hydroxy-6-hydroxymethyldihydropteridine diphosphokinase
MTEAVLSLGANLGDREGNLRSAIASIARLPGTELLALSPIYETEPFETPVPEENFLNCCVYLRTRLQAHTLLGACLGIEAGLGRVRTYRNAARVVDIDLLLFGAERSATSDLILPHPRMLERAFVLVPLADLFPSGIAMGVPFAKELRQLNCSGVQRFRDMDWRKEIMG